MRGMDKQAEMIKATQNKRLKKLNNQKKNMMSGQTKKSDYMMMKNTQSLLNRKNRKKMELIEQRKQQLLKSAKLMSKPTDMGKMSYNKSVKTTKKRIKTKKSSKANESPIHTSNLTLNEDDKGGRRTTGNASKPKKTEKRKDYQLNHMFKIINFLEEDEGLTNQREKFREKMRQLKRATYKGSENDDDKTLDAFDVKMTIGVGSYAVVKLCVEKETGKEFAIKIYDRIKMLDPIKMKNYKSEVENLMDIDHPNIIRLDRVLEGRKKFAMVMEYVGHSSLYEVLERQSSKKLSEPCKLKF